MMTLDNGDGPVLVIDVPDIKKHPKKVEKAGGHVAMPPVGDRGSSQGFMTPSTTSSASSRTRRSVWSR
jgi:predicted enzyme related to lactoylglutathione lyase